MLRRKSVEVVKTVTMTQVIGDGGVFNLPKNLQFDVTFKVTWYWQPGRETYVPVNVRYQTPRGFREFCMGTVSCTDTCDFAKDLPKSTEVFVSQFNGLAWSFANCHPFEEAPSVQAKALQIKDYSDRVPRNDLRRKRWRTFHGKKRR